MTRSMTEPIIRAQINNVVTRPASDLMPIPEIENDPPEDAIRKLQTQIFYLVDVIVALQGQRSPDRVGAMAPADALRVSRSGSFNPRSSCCRFFRRVFPSAWGRAAAPRRRAMKDELIPCPNATTVHLRG
jgi:hypothetical protein